MKKSSYFIILLCFLAGACIHKGNDPLEAALESAGSNRSELEKVLHHYSGPGDSLKLKAATFLIANMPYHFGYYGDEIERRKKIFFVIDSLFYREGRVTDEDRYRVGDSLINLYGYPNPELLERVPDTRIMTADYLISNIELAFSAWKKAAWSKKVNFSDFCDYILPYRLREEQLQQWRPAFYAQYAPMAARYPHPDSPRFLFNAMSWDLSVETNFNISFSKYFPYPQSLSDVLMGKVGGCETTSFFSGAAMRAAGLPVGLDFMIHWGNTNNRHYMLRLIEHSHDRPLLTNQNQAKNTWYLVDFSTEFDERRHIFTDADMPEGLYVQYVRTIPKVYRYLYSLSPLLQEINETVPEGEIYREFRSANFKDVTEEYLQCSDYTLKIEPALKQFQLAYLCVFDINGPEPVALSRIGNDSAVFRNIGRYVVYVPAVCQDSVLRPAGSPFYIDSTNSVHLFQPTAGRTADLRLLRKTALYSYTAYHAEIMKGGRFEGANDPGFSRPVVLDSIRNYPFYMNEVELKSPSQFRYLRYVAPHTDIREADNIAELQFYEEGSSTPLKGQFIGSDGVPGHEIAKAFDGNMDSYYENKAYKDGWIGLDLGEQSQAKVARIKFCPRNDTNCIIPGLEYELFYWDGRWISLGIQKAADHSLIYQKVPAGAVYWLKCLSGGQEERPFTYENGRQVWW